MVWEVVLARSAAKQLRKLPASDRQRILAAPRQMESDPFSGDIAYLKSQPSAFHRRVGNWRILYDLDFERRVVGVAAIVRRTSTTY